MLELIESLSLVSGAFVVTGISIAIALFSGRLKTPAFRWVAVIGAPLLVSSSLYWLPVWLGANSSEYSAWAFAFILPWSLFGALASLVVVIAVRQYTNAKSRRNA